MTPQFARQLVDLRLDPQLQKQLDRLADKCNEGRLSPKERATYESYVSAIDVISILQSKARRVLARLRDAG